MDQRGHPLLDSAFQRQLRRVLLRRRIAAEWLDDAVGEVIVRTLEAVADPAPQWHALATAIAVMLADLFARGRMPKLGWQRCAGASRECARNSATWSTSRGCRTCGSRGRTTKTTTRAAIGSTRAADSSQRAAIGSRRAALWSQRAALSSERAALWSQCAAQLETIAAHWVESVALWLERAARVDQRAARVGQRAARWTARAALSSQCAARVEPIAALWDQRAARADERAARVTQYVLLRPLTPSIPSRPRRPPPPDEGPRPPQGRSGHRHGDDREPTVPGAGPSTQHRHGPDHDARSGRAGDGDARERHRASAQCRPPRSRPGARLAQGVRANHRRRRPAGRRGNSHHERRHDGEESGSAHQAALRRDGRGPVGERQARRPVRRPPRQLRVAEQHRRRQDLGRRHAQPAGQDEITGLPVGSTVQVRFRAIIKGGPDNWSQPLGIVVK